jgi:hypothetical protein
MPDSILIVTVVGGVVQDVTGIPPGVTVEVRDYDNGETDALALVDAKGDRYSPDTYESPVDPLGQPYSVLLRLPDYLASDPGETSLVHVRARNRSEAVAIARRQSAEAHAARYESEPEDFAAIALFAGHVFDINPE